MSALVEAGLRRVLAEPSPSEDERDTLPVLPSWRSGGALLDISNRAELYKVMDEE